MLIFLKLLLSSGLMFIAETASIHNESVCYQPSKYIKSIHYDVKLLLSIEGSIFYGECNISISILNKTQSIFLHSGKLCIENMVLFTNLVKDHENDENIVYEPTYNKINEDIIHVSFLDKLLPRNYILSIKYYGIIDEFFRIFGKEDKFALVSGIHFHVINTRRLSSCWDQENSLLEATFNISIGCNECTALSNMPLRHTEENEFKMLWTHFDTTSAMSPYLATIIVFNYLLRIDDDNRNIEMWCRKEFEFYLKFAKNVAEEITLLFKYKWKQRLNNISKVTHVAIPNIHDNNIIVSGLVFYNETDIIYNENLYHVADKIEVAHLVGHKVTQQLLYNLNNPFRPTSWLVKTLTTLVATYAVNEIYTDNRIINLFVVQNRHNLFYLDGDFHMWNSTLSDSSLKRRISFKGYQDIQDIKTTELEEFFILHMLEYTLTGKMFWKNTSSYANSTQTFLEKIVAEVESQNIDVPLLDMESWISERHRPLIKVARNYKDSRNQIHISIQNFDILIIDCLFITYTSQTYHNFNNFIYFKLCKSKDLVVLGKDGWLIFNIQQIGYYRVNYDDENWRRISNYLNSYEYTKIHVLNRAQLIDDAFHLMIAGQLQSYIFWDITEYLHQEEDYIAWYPMFKALEYIFSTFPVTSMSEKKIEDFTSRVKHALHKLLEKIEYKEIDTDDFRICLRQEAARWACFLGDITCRKEANNKLKEHIDDHRMLTLLPWWKEWTYCKGLMITIKEEDTWIIVYIIGLETLNTKFLEYLACPEDTDLIKKYLTFIQNPKKRKYPNFSNRFLYIITKHAKNKNILEYILNNFYELKPRNVSIPAALIIIINNVYSINLTQLISTHVEMERIVLNVHMQFSKKKRIRAVLKKVLRKIKYEKIDDTDEFRIMLRQEAARWACFLGEITCMKQANNKLKQHLNDSMTHRLLPWWTAWTYCRGLMITTMNEPTFRSVYIMGLKRTDLKFSEYLACIGDTNLIKDYLSFKQYTHTKQEDQFLANTFLHFIAKHAKNPIILTYLLDNFNEIKPK